MLKHASFLWTLIDTIIRGRQTENAKINAPWHHVGGVWKRRFHFVNSINKNVFRPHYAESQTSKSNWPFWNDRNISSHGFCLRKTQSGKSRDHCDVIVFEKLCFQNGLCPYQNENPVFGKFLRFGEGFRWKAPFSWRISVDGGPNCRNGATSGFQVQLRYSDGPTSFPGTFAREKSLGTRLVMDAV